MEFLMTTTDPVNMSIPRRGFTQPLAGSVNGDGHWQGMAPDATPAEDFFHSLETHGYPLYTHYGEPTLAAQALDDGECVTFCPAHEPEGEHDPSLFIRVDGERVLAWCFVCEESQYSSIMRGDIPDCIATPREHERRESGGRGGGGGKFVAEIEIHTDGQLSHWGWQQAEGIEETTYYYGD